MDETLKKEFKKLADPYLTCPADIKGIDKVIELKNDLTKELSNIEGKINSVAQTLDIPKKIIDVIPPAITIGKIAIDVIGSIPSTSFTPIPSGPIVKVGQLLEKLDKIVTKAKPTLGSATGVLNSLKDELQKVLDLLEMVDMFLLKCTEEMDYGSESAVQDQISQELLTLTEKQSQNLSPKILGINGFDIEVITESTLKPHKRRRAIARNKEGLVMIRGELSFSSVDQILIDELVYYIKQNNLNAE